MRRGALLAGVILAVTALAPPASAADFGNDDVTFHNGGVTLHAPSSHRPAARSCRVW